MSEYDILFPDELERKLLKLRKKDPALYRRLFKKIVAIAQRPYIGKPLRNVLKNRWRVHVGSFVLIYKIDEENKVVKLLEFEHYDKVYK